MRLHQVLSMSGSEYMVHGVQVGDEVEAMVELVKPDYAVLSLPERGGRIAFAAADDRNLRASDAPPRFAVGQKVAAVVASLGTPETGAQSF